MASHASNEDDEVQPAGRARCHRFGRTCIAMREHVGEYQQPCRIGQPGPHRANSSHETLRARRPAGTCGRVQPWQGLGARVAGAIGLPFVRCVLLTAPPSSGVADQCLVCGEGKGQAPMDPRWLVPLVLARRVTVQRPPSIAPRPPARHVARDDDRPVDHRSQHSRRVAGRR